MKAGRTRPISGSRASGLRWDLNEWNRGTVHWAAQLASLLHAMGMVGTEKVFPMLGPALVVQDHVNAWAEKDLSVALGTAGGE